MSHRRFFSNKQTHKRSMQKRPWPTKWTWPCVWNSQYRFGISQKTIKFSVTLNWSEAVAFGSRKQNKNSSQPVRFVHMYFLCSIGLRKSHYISTYSKLQRNCLVTWWPRPLINTKCVNILSADFDGEDGYPHHLTVSVASQAMSSWARCKAPRVSVNERFGKNNGRRQAKATAKMDQMDDGVQNMGMSSMIQQKRRQSRQQTFR